MQKSHFFPVSKQDVPFVVFNETAQSFGGLPDVIVDRISFVTQIVSYPGLSSGQWPCTLYLDMNFDESYLLSVIAVVKTHE